MKYKVDIYGFFVGFLLLVSPLVCLSAELYNDIYKLLIPTVFLMQVVLVRKLKNVHGLLILTLYAFVYFLYFIPYYYWGIQLSQYTKYQNVFMYNKLLVLFYLFYLGISLSAVNGMNKNKERIISYLNLDVDKKYKYFFLIFFLLCFFMVLRTGDNVLLGNSPYEMYMENMGKINVLPRLVIIFSLIIYLLKLPYSKLLLSFFLLVFVYWCITRGTKILIPPLLMSYYLFYYDLKFKVKYIIFFTLLIGVGLVFVNSLKMGTAFQLSMLFSEGENDFLLSHHADNLYGSVVALSLIERHIISFWDRLICGIGLLLEMIIPPKFLPVEMKYPLNVSVHAFGEYGGGGLCITGAYLMWGYLGVFLFAYLLSEFVRKAYIFKNSLYSFICIIVLVFFSNWFSYDFHILLRFPFYGIVLYFLLSHLKKNGKEKKENTYS